MADIIQITDFSAPELDIYARLSEPQLKHYYEPHGGLFLAESPMIVERALNAGCQPVSLLVEEKYVCNPESEGADSAAEQYIRSLIDRCGDVPVYTADGNLLKNLTGFPLTRGILCAMKRPDLPALESVCEGACRIAILENVMNPTNIGAIFRSAAALNIDAILLTSACSDPLYRRASRVSMGTVFQIPWTYFEEKELPWPDKAMEKLRSLGFKTAAMALRDDTVSIDDPALLAEEKLAIVLGTEGDGLADSTITGCDYTVKIPMAHGVDSLNVAAASAVAFWELGKKSR